MAPTKAEGLDGFSTIFFQRYWDSVIQLVHAFIDMDLDLVI